MACVTHVQPNKTPKVAQSEINHARQKQNRNKTKHRKREERTTHYKQKWIKNAKAQKGQLQHSLDMQNMQVSHHCSTVASEAQQKHSNIQK
jgi:hypothetical protein